jgi:hypothetical protein
MEIWETLALAFGSISVFVVLHVAIFLLVRWMYPPTVMPMPMVVPPAAAPPPPTAPAAPVPPKPAAPAEIPLPEYYTQPAKKENAPTDAITLPMAPSSQEGSTSLDDLQGRPAV